MTSAAVQDRLNEQSAQDAFNREQAERAKYEAAKPGLEDDRGFVDEHGRPTRDGWREIGRNFRKPMPTKAFKGKGGRSFDYITARQVAARLDAVVGPGNWSTDWQCLRADHPVAVRYGVAIFGVWKWDTGYSNNPDADEETDKAYEDEPLKAACSDGFKRAAVLWGIGRWLYGDA